MGDNIMPAHELVKGYQREYGDPRCAVKADIMKAFYSVDWMFLLQVLRATVVQTSHIEGKEGVRQGDPLSPLLDRAAVDGKICYHPKRKRIQLTNLGFADHMLIFLRGGVQSLKELAKVLKYFHYLFGLKLNPAKTELLCASLNKEEENLLLPEKGQGARMGTPQSATSFTGEAARRMLLHELPHPLFLLPHAKGEGIKSEGARVGLPAGDLPHWRDSWRVLVS
ncbi:hypothetical protein CRG98_004302 [Punica granatum]|uniref:Reverse transcriptase domain-containing protein n=1 Tax=Punica granatum TaxID=22663 RepID=A0A2I0L3J0_PUNGR|nr:hypothetical protein CRG98_004302 [Punica granatum]